jgi:hypothetical protein
MWNSQEQQNVCTDAENFAGRFIPLSARKSFKCLRRSIRSYIVLEAFGGRASFRIFSTVCSSSPLCASS